MKKLQEEVIVRGGRGVGKRLFVEGIQRRAKEAEVTFITTNPPLDTRDKNFTSELCAIREEHSNLEAELSIIVILDEASDLQISFTCGLSYDLSTVLFP